MKRNNRGFTLIELIMVIVILGILAAVVVPKFFSFTTQAHEKHKDAVYGTMKSALQLYAANQLVTAGTRTFPVHARPDLDDQGVLLDEIPEGWTYTPGTGVWLYSGDAGTITYACTGDSSSFTLTKDW